MPVLILLLSACASVRAIELEIRFPLLEKQLAQQLFTQDGKRYVKGNAKTKCNFAYLADPHFKAREGRLLIQARFTGRSSLDLLGKCVGFGDSFDLEVVAGLTTRGGTLILVQPKVQILSRDTYYSRQVKKALEASIADAVQYPIRDEVRRLLTQASQAGPYKISIGKLEIRSLQIQNDSLVVDVDTRFLVE